MWILAAWFLPGHFDAGLPEQASAPARGPAALAAARAGTVRAVDCVGIPPATALSDVTLRQADGGGSSG